MIKQVHFENLNVNRKKITAIMGFKQTKENVTRRIF